MARWGTAILTPEQRKRFLGNSSGSWQPSAQPLARKRKLAAQPLARKRKLAGPPIAGQPLAPRLAREALEEFIARFGATPPVTSPIWKEAQPWLPEAEKQFKDLVGRCKRLSKPTLKKAERFLVNFETNRPIKKYTAWAAMCRHRLQRQPSVLASALTGMAGAGAGAPKQNVIQMAQESQAVDVEGPVAVIKFNTAIGVIGLTPFAVGNWLYQATVDVYNAFHNILGLAVHRKGNHPGHRHRRSGFVVGESFGCSP